MNLPSEILETFREFRTAEMTTISRRGEPITWPVATSFDESTQRFIVTTSIGLPAKASNLRRNPRVGLLFSDATASGLRSPATVMAQGLAEVADDVIAVEGLEEYWKTLWVRQPVSKLYSLPVVRRFADYYYMRIVMTITPTRIVWCPGGDLGGKPNEIRLESQY
jgi:hypothetical protein